MELVNYMKWMGWGVLVVSVTACAGTHWGEQLGQTLRGREESIVEETPIPQPPRPNPTPTELAPDPTPTEVSVLPEDPVRFVDLDPDGLATQAILNLESLGVFTDLEGDQFEPNRSVKRGEFVQWLVLANNALRSQALGQQIRLQASGERPIFLDVPEDHPYFDYIQALGAAGFVTGDDNQEFHPERLLSRADLIQIKAPLDRPPGQISGSRSDVEAGWGFSDADQIPAEAVPAIVVDRQLEEYSTILRTFGPIRTFKPLDPVTRAEVALALSQFGEPVQVPLASPEPTARPSLAPSPTPLESTSDTADSVDNVEDNQPDDSNESLDGGTENSLEVEPTQRIITPERGGSPPQVE